MCMYQIKSINEVKKKQNGYCIHLCIWTVKELDNKGMITRIIVKVSYNWNTSFFNKLLQSIHIKILQTCGFEYYTNYIL